MRLDEAKTGMHVRYIPGHAHGDRGHPDCEDGTVTSVGEQYVFVRFRALQNHGTACDPNDLIKVSP